MMCVCFFFFFFKQKTAYEMRISDWSSDVCSSDLLYRALRDDDEALAVHAYESWGFHDLGRETIDVLNVWARFLYGPLLEDRERRIKESGSGLYGRENAEQVPAEPRRLNGVRPPREVVLVERAALGLATVLMLRMHEGDGDRIFSDPPETYYAT